MFVLQREMPNGAVARFHRVDSFGGHVGGMQILVDSYNKEDLQLVVWRDTYPAPAEAKIGTIADAEAMLVAPGAAFAGGQVVEAGAADLNAVRTRLRTEVSLRAEAVRCKYLTPGSGQAITYARKEAEARSWSAGGDPATVPFLAAEAAATGSTIDELAAVVIAQADAWVAIGAAIEARRRALLVELDEATTTEAVAAIAITAGWPDQA